MMQTAALLAAVCLAVMTTVGQSAEPAATHRLERVEVPLDQIEQWPAFSQKLIAVSRAEFERRFAASRPQPATPPEVIVESTSFEATLVGDTLTAGTGVVHLRCSGAQSAWLPLAGINLAVSSVTRDGSVEPVIWGAAADGKLWIHVDEPDVPQIWAWSLAGQRIAGRTNFDIRIPAALSSRFRIRCPSGCRLSSPEVTLRPLQNEADSEWTTWEALVGGEGAFRLSVDPAPVAVTPPLLSYRRQLTAGIREDHLRFEANFQLEVLGGEVGELQFETPNTAEIYSVTWGGDVPLAWNLSPLDGPRHLVRVKLPDRQTGVLRQIRLEGIVAQRLGAVITLPQIELQGGYFRSGTVQVSVTRPLEVVSLKPRGCRQESPVLATADGETFQFEQMVPGAQVTVEVRPPRFTLTAQVLSALSCDPEEWSWRSEILWSSKAGAAFQLAVRVPPGWEVTDVSPLAVGGRESRIGWELVPDADGTMRIAIELLEALTPDRPQRVSIWARRSAPELLAAFACPILAPLDCQSTATVTQVSGGRQFEVYSDPRWLNSEVAPENLAASWAAFGAWANLRESGRGGARWYQTSDPTDPPRFTIYSKPAPITAEVSVDVETQNSLLLETYRIRVLPIRSGPVTRLLVELTEAGEHVDWEVKEPAGWQLVSSRIPNEHRPNAVRTGHGELWELRLPAAIVEEIVVQGTRVRPLTLPSKVGLAFLPQATSTMARMSLELPESTSIRAVTRGLEDVGEIAADPPSSVSAPVQRLEWRYRNRSDELSLVSRKTSLQETPCVSRLELTSLISTYQEGCDYHRAVAVLPAHPRQLRFRFSEPVEILSARLGDDPLSSTSTNEVIVPPAMGDEGPRTLVVLYHSQQSSGFLWDRRQVPLPNCDDVVWTDCRWVCSVPPTAQIEQEPLNARMTIPPALPTWSDRLFGPMSRSATQVFLPWRPESWTELLSAERLAPTDVLSTDGFLTAPLEWQQFVAYAPAAVSELELLTWHAGRLRLLSWLTLLATLTAVLTVRASALVQRTRLAAVWLAVWLGMAVAAEAPYADFVGAVLAGTLLGWLAPRRWLVWHLPERRRDPVVPVGSTQSFTLPRSAVTTGLLLAVWIAGGASGHSAPVELELDPDQVVLVPVDSRGEASPLIYVSPATWDWLCSVSIPEPPSTPTALIQSADYRATLGLGQRVAVSAEFEVLVMGTDSQVTLPLPVSAIGAGAAQGCRVDGEPATMTSLVGQTGFQVAWTRPSQPLSALGLERATKHRVQVEWQHAWRRESGLAVFELEVPIAAVARMQLGPLPSGSLTEEGEQAEVSTGADKSETSTQTRGFARSLQVWWRELDLNAEPIEVHLESAEAWDLRPGLVDVRSRTTFRPRTGAARRFFVDLPKGSVVRRWSSSQPAEFRISSATDPLEHGLLEFSEHLAAPAVVDIEFVTPVPNALGELSWTGLFWRSGGLARLVTGSRLWAISTPNEISVQPESLEESGLVPVSLESVQTQFADLLVDRPPQAIYQVGNSAAVKFRTKPVTTTRRMVLWQQTGTVESDRLKWEIEGELDVTGLPVYTHVLTIDRRLSVESISVRERGTDRLARWSETRSATGNGSRITLFLSDPAMETQRITLTASIPLNHSSPVPLPNVRCEEALLAGGRLVLRMPAAAEIAFAGARGLKELTTDNGSSAGKAERSLTRIFDQTDPDWRATIRVLSAADVRSPRAIHLIASENPQTLQCTSLWRFPRTKLREPVMLVVPAPWDISLEQSAIGGSLRTEPGADGSHNVLLTGDSMANETLVILRLSAQRAALVNDLLPLPRPVGEIAAGLRQWTGDLTRMPQSPLLSSNGTSLSTQPPADWGDGSWQEPALAENDRLHWNEIPADQWQVTLAPVSPAPNPVLIEWLEHFLWRDQAETTSGETHVRLAAPASIVATQFPAELEFRAALIGGRIAVTRSDADSAVQMSAPDGRPFTEVILLWRERSADRTTPVSYDELRWPVFPGATVRQLAVSILPPKGELLRGTGEWRRGDWIDRSLLRLESLGDQWLAASGLEAEGLQRDFLEQYRVTAKRLGSAIEEFHGSDTQRQTRWKAIVDRVNQIGPEVGEVLPQSKLMPQASQALVDHQDMVYGMLPPTAETGPIWKVERSWLRWLAAVLVTGVTWPILATLIRPSFGTWWQRHPNLATAVLGGVWWLCLAPSIVGFAIVMAAGYRAATAVRTPAPTPPAA